MRIIVGRKGFSKYIYREVPDDYFCPGSKGEPKEKGKDIPKVQEPKGADPIYCN